ncbi:MAG: endo alpha-1,4 polygalactosaminidase [Patescibacteria group bacterium]
MKLKITIVVLIVFVSVIVLIMLAQTNPTRKAIPLTEKTWQWQLLGPIDTSVNVDMYDIDLFDTPKSTIDKLHADGREVICYFSAGSFEDWRPDSLKFPHSTKGKQIDDFKDEQWLDIRQIALLSPIISERLDLAVTKGCDGVEPDNVDGYQNDSGFPLTYQDQIDYNIWLAQEAHKRDLSIGLKNDLDQIEDLVDYFDWALNEQCVQYNECNLLLPFIKAEKAVFGVEYEGSPDTFCPIVNKLGFHWIKKNMDLDAHLISCE